MVRWTIVALVVLACGKQAKETPPTPPEPAAPYACASDDDCVVSCQRKDDCCGGLCGCTQVQHRAEKDAIDAHNAKHCPADVKCPVAECAPPEHTAVPRCRSAKCEAELVPRVPRPVGPPPGVEAKPPLPARQVDGFWVVDGAPSPNACTVDADCKGDTMPGEDFCCNDPISVRPHAVKFSEWVNLTYRPAHCQDHDCPPPPPPSEPAACLFQVKCVDQRCANSCP